MNIRTIIAAACPPLGRPSWLLACVAVLAPLAHAQTGSPAAAEVGKVVQVVGQAQLEGRPLQTGVAVLEGQRISTGADGYLYVQTADKGFFILRPNSSARVPAYRVDAAQPANSRFKFELERGVARSISGQAVPAARQNYRFNTPVAAIGVLGTDFTVFTDQLTTRVAVSSGGVVVSGFGEGCPVAGTGPCETPLRQQLLASQVGQMLQVSRDSVAPQLLRGSPLAPDLVAPPRPDEPVYPAPAAANLTPLQMAGISEALRQAATPGIQWGRWASVAGQSANIDLLQAKQTAQLVGLNSYFAVFRHHGSANWVAPQEPAASFRLWGSDAQIATAAGAQKASLENGYLHVDFVRGNFSTGFGLTQGANTWSRQAQGPLVGDGTFGNASQYLGGNNMVVSGALAQSPNGGGLQAGYVFQSRIDNTRLASGVAYWGR